MELLENSRMNSWMNICVGALERYLYENSKESQKELLIVESIKNFSRNHRKQKIPEGRPEKILKEFPQESSVRNPNFQWNFLKKSRRILRILKRKYLVDSQKKLIEKSQGSATLFRLIIESPKNWDSGILINNNNTINSLSRIATCARRWLRFLLGLVSLLRLALRLGRWTTRRSLRRCSLHEMSENLRLLQQKLEPLATVRFQRSIVVGFLGVRRRRIRVGFILQESGNQSAVNILFEFRKPIQRAPQPPPHKASLSSPAPRRSVKSKPRNFLQTFPQILHPTYRIFIGVRRFDGLLLLGHGFALFTVGSAQKLHGKFTKLFSATH